MRTGKLLTLGVITQNLPGSAQTLKDLQGKVGNKQKQEMI